MNEPAPPDSLPQYLADGIPKQDLDTLQDIHSYVEELIEVRTAPVEESELPDSAEVVDSDSGGRGSIVKEKVKCGDDTCSCSSGNPEDMHGPYKYRYYREGGQMKSEYLGKA